MLEIPVLGRKIGVRFVSDRELNQIAKDTDCLGFFDGKTIRISSSLTQERSREVLFHEVTHAILARTGLTNLLDEKQEEAICDAFECLVEMFRDQELMKFLNNVEEEDL